MEPPRSDPPSVESGLDSSASYWYRIRQWMEGSTRYSSENDICGCSSTSLQGLPPRVSVEGTLSRMHQWQARIFSFFALQNWRVRTVTHALSAMGHPPSLVVVRCGAPQYDETMGKNKQQVEELGGYSPEYNTVWICGNRVWSPFNFRRVVLHELLHAFDFARAKIDTNNCEHIACTEIRAINLSGQCGLWASRNLSQAGFEKPLDKHLILKHSAKEIRRLQQEAVSAKLLSDEAAAAALDAAKAASIASTAAMTEATGSAGSSAATAALAKAERLAAQAAASAKRARDVAEAATAASRDVPLWQKSKRNACVANQARLSVQQLEQCRKPGVAEAAVASVFSRCLADTWPFEHPPEFDSRLRPSRIYEEHADALLSA